MGVFHDVKRGTLFLSLVKKVQKRISQWKEDYSTEILRAVNVSTHFDLNNTYRKCLIEIGDLNALCIHTPFISMDCTYRSNMQKITPQSLYGNP